MSLVSASHQVLLSSGGAGGGSNTLFRLLGVIGRRLELTTQSNIANVNEPNNENKVVSFLGRDSLIYKFS